MYRDMSSEDNGLSFSVHNVVTFILILTAMSIVAVFISGHVNPEGISILFIRVAILCLLTICMFINLVILVSDMLLDISDDSEVEFETKMALLIVSLVTLVLSFKYGVNLGNFSVNMSYAFFIGTSLSTLIIDLGLMTVGMITTGQNKSSFNDVEDKSIEIEVGYLTQDTQRIVNKIVERKEIVDLLNAIPKDEKALTTEREIYEMIGDEVVNILRTNRKQSVSSQNRIVRKAIREVGENKHAVGKSVYSDVDGQYDQDIASNDKNVSLLAKRAVYLGEAKEMDGQDIEQYLKILTQFLGSDMTKAKNVTPKKVEEMLRKNVDPETRVELEESIRIETRKIRENNDVSYNSDMSQRLRKLEGSRIFEDAYIGDIERTTL